jgi:glycosyltransferase involved in cell wall biosynthesis
MIPKISIIIPVYNTEVYLSKCINSILTQTFTDFELILVNDGSTDNSGQICDDYAKRDKRVIVIHQLNGGPGKARNSALQVAQGEYISFIDSDDWIADDMLQEMSYLMSSNNVDIVVMSHYTIDLDNSIKKVENTVVDKIINRIDATSLILEDKIIYSFAWDKLYKRKLFEGVKYPENRIIEDIPTTYKLINNAENIFLSNKAYYYYVRRETSSCLNINPDVTMKRKLDFFYGFYERYEFTLANKEYSAVLDNCFAKAFVQGQQLMHFIIKNKLDKANYRFESIFNKISNMQMTNNNDLTITQKLEHRLMAISMGFYSFFLNVFYFFKA